MKIVASLLASLATATALSAWACPGLQVEDAWIREAPPGAMMTAAYARLRNAGKHALTLDRASSEDFGSVELHHTVLQDGLFKMQPGRLTLPPGERGALEPGGWHLMLMEPVRPLKAGDRVSVMLQCGRERREFQFTVRAVAE